MLEFLDIILVLQLIFKSLMGVGVIVAAIVALMVFIAFSDDIIKSKGTTRRLWVVLVSVLAIASLVQIWLWR